MMDADVELIMNAESWDDKFIEGYDENHDSDSDVGHRNSNSRSVGTKLRMENLPTDMHWQDLKDLIRDQVGSGLEYFVDLLKDSSGRSMGEGIVNFNKSSVAEKALRKLDGLMVDGRKLSVREDSGQMSRKRKRTASPSHVTSKRIIVGNIPYNTTWQQLKDFFRDEIGSVDYAKVDESSDGVPKGSGVVSFHSTDKAREAISKLNNADFHGRKLFLKEDFVGDRKESFTPRRSEHLTVDPRILRHLGIRDEPSTTIYVGNLDISVPWQRIKDLFREAGNIQHVKIPPDQEGRSRGVAIVTFENVYDAVQAISMFNGAELHGRPLYVCMFTPHLERQMAKSMRRVSSSDYLNLENVGPYITTLEKNLGIQPTPPPVNNEVAGMAMVLQHLLGAGNLPGGTADAGSSRDHEDSRRRRHDNQTSAIIIENLDRTVSWQTLKDHFKAVGKVQFADVYKNPGRNNSGAVKFQSPEDAERAVRQMDGSRLGGKPIKVYLDI